MRILDCKNKRLADKVTICNNVFTRFSGLMFSRELKENEALLIEFPEEESASLHTVFVFFPIDVVWLNEKKEIVELKENFNPFSAHVTKTKAKWVIEFRAGKIKNAKLNVGQKIKLV